MAKRNIIPIFIPFFGCPVRCIYCDQNQITGAPSFISGDDVEAEIREALRKAGTQSPEVAFYGGTFTMLPEERRGELLRAVKPFIDAGEVSSIRISTRPEKLDAEDFSRLYEAGVRTIEFGIQSMDEAVLRSAGRGLTPRVMEETVERAREAGFSIGLQQMIGLPEDSSNKDIATAEWMAERADFVRIYATIVFRHTELYRLYREGRYRPLSLSEAIRRCARLLDLYEEAEVPVIRVGLPYMERSAYVAGPYHDNFREFAESKRTVEKILRTYPTVRSIEGSAAQINRVAGPYGVGRKSLERAYGPIVFRVTDGTCVVHA
ncbi:MAG: radical SAM protein [Peptoniphilus sp.]|nr:radical SAM protein [Peptoniphilus sp.]MDD7363871.1 radical SAM protein [Bacillota bacterium]MDY6044290.1 radical SAM protein [Peptoniphilus sp.]